MQILLLKKLNQGIVFLLALLGFTMVSQPCAAQYGAPPAFFKLKGVVLNEEKVPIKNIRIITKGISCIITDNDTVETKIYEDDTLYTNSEGVFEHSFYGRWDHTLKLDLKVEDIDKEKNGSYLPVSKSLFTKPNDDEALIIEMKKDHK